MQLRSRQAFTSLYVILGAIALIGAACLPATGTATGAPAPAKSPSYAAAFKRTALLRDAGRRIFSDRTFSASGRQSCASCHDPQRRYNPPNALDVQPGGGDMKQRGFRAPPTLTYLNRVPPYNNHYHDSDEEGDESVDAGPTGGLTWDGRVDRGENQARLPLLSEFEMASRAAGVAAAIRQAGYAHLLREALGEQALDKDEDAFTAVVHALGAF